MVSRKNINNVTVPILLTIVTRDGVAGDVLRSRVAARVGEFDFQLENGERVNISLFGM